jgi:hypothetical protein
MSGPYAEDAPLLAFQRVGERIVIGHDPWLWPLGIDTGVLESGASWVVIACEQDGCGAHLVELDQDQVRMGDWPISIVDMLQRVIDHADDCEAFRI